jgi:hypothetical protein
MIYSLFNAIITSFSLIITRNKDTFSNCPARIEALSIISPIFILNPARTVDRFFTVLSASAKSLS